MGELRGTYRKDIDFPDAEERRLVQIREMKRKLRDLYKNSDYRSIKNIQPLCCHYLVQIFPQRYFLSLCFS